MQLLGRWSDSVPLIDLSTPERRLWAAVLKFAILDYGKLKLRRMSLIHFESERIHTETEIDEFWNETNENDTLSTICEVLAGERSEEFKGMVKKFIQKATWQDIIDVQSTRRNKIRVSVRKYRPFVVKR